MYFSSFANCIARDGISQAVNRFILIAGQGTILSIEHSDFETTLTHDWLRVLKCNQLIVVAMAISIRRVEGVKSQRIVGSSTRDAVEIRRTVNSERRNSLKLSVN